MNDLKTCPNCSAELKSGWATNALIDSKKIEFINFVLKRKAPAYCDKCSRDLLSEARHIFDRDRNHLIRSLELNIGAIPIVSTHTPFGWQYEAISIVTGQSVTGTGFISEFKSDFSDFFGGQSRSFNKKLAGGEEKCFAQLRAKALKLGANAIIATDIDYGEAGAEKGMLMVCAAGTAVKITNLEVLGNKAQVIQGLIEAQSRLLEMEKFSLD